MSEPSVNSEVQPTLVFGANASGRKSFPATRPESGAVGYANFADGLPSDYSTDASSPLKARIDDVSAIGRLASGFCHYRQCGGVVTYFPDVAAAIGGYPKGAVLEHWDGTHLRRVASLLEDNLFNFVENPGYIDGVHWGYVDSWLSPYCIYVDPSRVNTLTLADGGGLNLALGWENDDEEWNYIWDVEIPQYVGLLNLKKSRWIRMDHDCFAVISCFPQYIQSITYLLFGFRLKQSDGTLVTYSKPVDEDGNVAPGSAYPVYGTIPYSGGTPITYYYEWGDVGSSCLYMRRGSMLQIVCASSYVSLAQAQLQIVRLRR